MLVRELSEVVFPPDRRKDSQKKMRCQKTGGQGWAGGEMLALASGESQAEAAGL